MPITALPTPPSRSDSPQDFSDRADALLGALPGFVTEANALQSDVNAKESIASSHATVATDKAAEAQGYATTATTKAGEAAASAIAAAAAAGNAEIAFDSFDDKYLGSKAADPATDNDGNPLLTGALYWNTTVGTVRVWNGSAWLSMAADASIVDFQQSGTGAVVRTAQEKLREWVSVKDFGAVGDGVADDTAAIQAAIDYCLSFDPPKALAVPSMCRIDSTLIIDREIDTANASTYFTINGFGSGGFYAYIGLNLFSTTLTNPTTGQIVASQKVHFDGIVFRSAFPTNPTYVLDDAKFLRMKFTNCDFHRIKLVNATRYLQTYYFNNCMAYGWIGTFINGTNGAYDIKIDNFVAEAGGSFYSVVCNGVYSLDPNAQISITNSLFQSISSFTVQADKAQGFVVENCYFEENGADGSPDLKFDTANNIANATPNHAITVKGCWFSQRLVNFNEPGYYSVRWGRVRNGFAAGNTLADLGTGASLKLHALIPESRVVVVGDDGVAGHINTSEAIYAQGGYFMEGGEAVRFLRGEVSSTGSVAAGIGFSVAKTGAGEYVITFTVAFSSLPTITASAKDSSGTSACALTDVLSSSQATVKIRNAANAFIDSAFSFIVCGPA